MVDMCGVAGTRGKNDDFWTLKYMVWATLISCERKRTIALQSESYTSLVAPGRLLSQVMYVYRCRHVSCPHFLKFGAKLDPRERDGLQSCVKMSL